MLDNTQIASVIKRLKVAMRHLPDPSVTLVGKKFKDPFLVLISCLLSLRTKDTTTLPVSEKLFEQVSTIDGFLKIPVKQLEKMIYPVGFYRTKAIRIHEICHGLKDRFGSKVPDTIDELLTLKGVGRKTANLVLTEGFGKLGVRVD
ncbi:MAG: endonuclease III, partial [Candidatus Omnitrophota bacterium]